MVNRAHLCRRLVLEVAARTADEGSRRRFWKALTRTLEALSGSERLGWLSVRARDGFTTDSVDFWRAIMAFKSLRTLELAIDVPSPHHLVSPSLVDWPNLRHLSLVTLFTFSDPSPALPLRAPIALTSLSLHIDPQSQVDVLAATIQRLGPSLRHLHFRVFHDRTPLAERSDENTSRLVYILLLTVERLRQITRLGVHVLSLELDQREVREAINLLYLTLFFPDLRTCVLGLTLRAFIIELAHSLHLINFHITFHKLCSARYMPTLRQLVCTGIDRPDETRTVQDSLHSLDSRTSLQCVHFSFFEDEGLKSQEEVKVRRFCDARERRMMTSRVQAALEAFGKWRWRKSSGPATDEEIAELASDWGVTAVLNIDVDSTSIAFVLSLCTTIS